MAKKKKKKKKKKRASTSKRSSGRKRKRRTPDQIIADLQEEIRRVRSRQLQRELKASPAYKASLAAIKSIDRALEAAAEEREATLRHALADARRALGAHMEKLGVQLPKARLPKGPRPRQG